MTLTMNELRAQHWSRVYAASIGAGMAHQHASDVANASMAYFNRRWGVQ